MNEDIFINDVEKCLQVLQNGGTILYPTDTIWGIGCDATNYDAVQKIFDVKHRPAKKSYVVLVAYEKDIIQYTASPDLSVFDYLQTITKPTTVIYEHAIGLAENACNEDGSVAIRICDDAFCRHLIKRLKKPIVSTSANISGEPSPKNFHEINSELKKAVDYVVQYRQNEQLAQQASAIIKWQNGEAIIIRS